MSNMPFALSEEEANAFAYDVGWSVLGSLPQWGGVVLWRNRFVLAYERPDGKWAFTDITGGIPDASVPGGMLPAATLVSNVPKTQASSIGVFLYSLPANFMAVAREKAIAASQTIGEIAAPLLPAGTILAVIAVAVIIFMYVPRSRN